MEVLKGHGVATDFLLRHYFLGRSVGRSVGQFLSLSPSSCFVLDFTLKFRLSSFVTESKTQPTEELGFRSEREIVLHDEIGVRASGTRPSEREFERNRE